MGLVTICILVLLWVRHNFNGKIFDSSTIEIDEFSTKKMDYSHIPAFSNRLKGFEQISQICYKQKRPQSVEDISKFVLMLRQNTQSKLCQEQYKLFRSLYNIRTKTTTVVLSDTFLPKVKKWMNGNEELVEATKKQTIIFVDNHWSLESVVFNPVRAKRPGGQGDGNVADYVSTLIAKAKDTCDFCSYDKYTAHDTFGILSSERSVAISNTFKIEKYHGMIVFKQHDPVHFNQDQFIDAMDLAMVWFMKTSSLVPSHKYRHMYWDILPKASASQIHPHIHTSLGDYSYYSKWNKMHKAALQYSKDVPNWNYWSVVLQIHNALGLSTQ